jgi:hypothetical protein
MLRLPPQRLRWIGLKVESQRRFKEAEDGRHLTTLKRFEVAEKAKGASGRPFFMSPTEPAFAEYAANTRIYRTRKSTVGIH